VSASDGVFSEPVVVIVSLLLLVKGWLPSPTRFYGFAGTSSTLPRRPGPHAAISTVSWTLSHKVPVFHFPTAKRY